MKLFKDKKNFLYLILGLVIVGELIWGVFSFSSLTKAGKTKKAEAFLSLSPPKGSFRVGETFEVSVLLDLKNVASDGADIILNYDPKKLEVRGFDKLTSEIQVKEGDLFDQYALRKADVGKGQIFLSVFTFTPQTSSGTLGTISFKTLQPGETKISFEFIPGSTTDSNVAEHTTTQDILTKVKGGIYTIVE